MNNPHQIVIFILDEGGATLVERKMVITDYRAPDSIQEVVDDMIDSTKNLPTI